MSGEARAAQLWTPEQGKSQIVTRLTWCSSIYSNEFDWTRLRGCLEIEIEIEIEKRIFFP